MRKRRPEISAKCIYANDIKMMIVPSWSRNVLAALLFCSLAALAGGSGCDDEDAACSLSGSIGETRSLSFDRVKVRLYRPAAGEPADELLIEYLVDGSGDKPAVLAVELEGLTLNSGVEVDLTEMLAITRTRGVYYWVRGSAHDYPPLSRGTLTIERWGSVGTEVRGRFFLVFEDSGRNLKGEFAAKLEEVIQS